MAGLRAAAKVRPQWRLASLHPGFSVGQLPPRSQWLSHGEFQWPPPPWHVSGVSQASDAHSSPGTFSRPARTSSSRHPWAHLCPSPTPAWPSPSPCLLFPLIAASTPVGSPAPHPQSRLPLQTSPFRSLVTTVSKRESLESPLGPPSIFLFSAPRPAWGRRLARGPGFSHFLTLCSATCHSAFVTVRPPLGLPCLGRRLFL